MSLFLDDSVFAPELTCGPDKDIGFDPSKISDIPYRTAYEIRRTRTRQELKNYANQGIIQEEISHDV